MPDNTPLSPAEEKHIWEAMPPRERIIWRGWLKLHAARFDRYEYNVRVGVGNDVGSGYTPEQRAQWANLTKKRLDVLAWNGNHSTIIEVEESPGLSAIGQLQGYDVLWRADHPAMPAPRLLLVCARGYRDAVFAITKSGIEINVVEGVDYSELRRKQVVE